MHYQTQLSPQDGTFKVLRGGSWNDTSNISSAYRYKTDQNVSDNHRIGFRLALRDTNKAPIDLNSSGLLAFEENQPIGKVVGEFNATDPDGDGITYHFANGDNSNSLFTLDTNGTLKTARTFDYESNASTYTITVQAKDELNATTEGNFTVTLLDLDDEVL